MATPNAHAKLSASGSHRWLNCTAAPTFEANFPDEPASSYAQEGTLAHSICELFASKYFGDMTTRKFNSRLNKLRMDPLFNEEMIQTAEAYLEHLKSWAFEFADTPHVALEVRVDLSDYVPDGFGTCDCVMIGDKHLHISDYKHGKGVAVSARDNSQMRLYALGALKKYGILYEIDHVSMAICQPRLSDDPNFEELTAQELLAWGERMKPVAKAAYDGPGEFKPGEHCRFCKGRAQCRARADQHSALADFAGCVPEGRVPEEQRGFNDAARSVIGLPPILRDSEIGELIQKGELMKQWLEDLKAYALQRIMSGAQVDGLKVVEGTSRRAFKDTDAALAALEGAGYERAMLYDTTPKSLATLEKMIGKKAFAELMADHIQRPPGKATLALVTDKRPEFRPAVADFAGIANG